MRYSTIATSIRESSQNRQYDGKGSFRAVTNSVTPVELFLDGQPSRRLVPALDSTTLLNCYGVIHTVAASTFTNRRALIRNTAAGVLSFVDLDATTAGLNDVELASSVATASGATTLTVPVAPISGAGSLTFSLVQPATVGGVTTPGYIVLTYTPAVATTTYVELRADFIEAGSRG